MDTFEADLAGFAHDWTMRDQALSTLKEYERQLRRYRAHTEAESISLQHARAFVMHEAERSKSSAKLAHRALRAFSKWCANEYDEPDPLLKLVKPRESAPTRTPTATLEDIEGLLKACEGPLWRDRRDHALICVLASTGLRRAEVARIRLDELDLATGMLLVPITKTRKTRVVRLDSRAVRSVRKYLRVRPDCPEVLWVSNKARPLGPNGVRLAFKKRAEHACVAITCHSMRRGFAVEWLRRGGSEAYLQQIAGWSSGAMVQRYVSEVAQEQALDQHARLFG